MASAKDFLNNFEINFGVYEHGREELIKDDKFG